jgi:hypothetical protein
MTRFRHNNGMQRTTLRAAADAERYSGVGMRIDSTADREEPGVMEVGRFR